METHLQKLSLKLLNFLEEEFLCDTVIITKDKKFKAHSVLLAATSPLFKSMFDANQGPALYYINLPDFESNTVQIMLNFIYSGTLVLSPFYNDMDQLPGLISTLSNLGLDAASLDGCEMKFVSKEELKKEASNSQQGEQTIDECLDGVSETVLVNTEASEEDGVQASDSKLNLSKEIRKTLKPIFKKMSLRGNLKLKSTRTTKKRSEKQHLKESEESAGEPDMNSDSESSIPTLLKDAADHIKELKRQSLMKSSEKSSSDLKSDQTSEDLEPGDTIDSNGFHVCGTCGKLFEKRKNLIRHKRLHYGKKYYCESCDKVCNTNAGLILHRRTHTGEKPYTCSTCGKSFGIKNNLLRHSRLHTGAKPYLCHDCGKGFIQKVSMLDHMAKHSTEKKFACTTCGEQFLKSIQLTKHNAIAHLIKTEGDQPGNNLPMLCDTCGKEFTTYQGLRQHIKQHTSGKEFACSSCNKKFYQKQQLDQHFLIHTGEKPYVCSTCGKAYRSKQQLQVHESYHTGEVPFKCPDCNKGFKYNCSLVSHMRYHTGERPYECKTCGKNFLHKCTMIVHMRNHTGEKPYKCNLCGTCFKQSNHLKVHIRSHTGEKPFICNVCGKTYKNRLDLRLHSTREHQINITKGRNTFNSFVDMQGDCTMDSKCNVMFHS